MRRKNIEDLKGTLVVDWWRRAAAPATVDECSEADEKLDGLMVADKRCRRDGRPSVVDRMLVWQVLRKARRAARCIAIVGVEARGADCWFERAASMLTGEQMSGCQGGIQ